MTHSKKVYEKDRYAYVTDVKLIDQVVQQVALTKKKFYVAGILGCSMQSIADYLKKQDFAVVGVDTKSKDTNIFKEHSKSNVNEEIGVVIMSHIFNEKPFEDIEQANYLQIPIILRLDFLRYIFFKIKETNSNAKLISVFGTSGKTTTTVFYFYLNRILGGKPSVFCGGYIPAINNNYHISTGDIVLETDESSIDHLKVETDQLVLLSMTPDHLEAEEYDNSFKKMKHSFLEQVNNAKSVMYYSDLGDLDDLIKQSNKHNSTNCKSYSDVNPNSDCYVYNFRESAFGSTFTTLIRKDNYTMKVDIAVPFTGRRNLLNYASAVYNYGNKDNILQIIDKSRYAQLPSERNTYCGEINNMKLFNNFAQLVPEWLSVLQNYQKISPQDDIFVVIELVREERYNRELPMMHKLLPYVKKIMVAPVYSYIRSQYCKSSELDPHNLEKERYVLYDDFITLHNDIMDLTNMEKGVLMCFGFNTPFSMRILNSQVEFIENT